MANYRKSFNFRSGVQVDTENFVVTPLGLVGIGTTIPTELLDVRGTATVTGLVTTSDLYVSGISTFNEVTVSGDTVTAGVVTASYFYGDGSGLTNIPTSQWVDTDVGLGYTSIYAAGNVGVASTDPRHTLQVGSDPTVSGQYGVGISSSGNIYSSGIVTAVSFVGDGSQLTGIGVTRDVRTNSFVVSGVSTFNSTLNGVYLNNATNVKGTSNIAIGEDALLNHTSGNNSIAIGWRSLYNASNSNFSNLGIGYMSGYTLSNGVLNTFLGYRSGYDMTGGSGNVIIGSFDGDSYDLDIRNSDDYIVLSSNGQSSTAPRLVIDGTGNTGIGSTNPKAKLDVGGTLNVSGVSTFVGNVTASGDLSLSGNLDVDGKTDLDIVDISETLNVVGVSTFTGNIDANGDLDVDGHTELDQLNVSGLSTFVGNSIFESGNVTVGSGNSSAVLRFGDTENTFDIINNETGNINMYLHNGDVGVSTGRFDWIYGQTNQELMSLNYDGKLGLGKTDPDNTLHVVGTSTVTGNAWFGGDVTISGTLNSDSIILPSIITSSNILSSSGVSTFFNLDVTNNVTISNSVGIGSSVPIVSLDAQNKTALFGTIGINTYTEPDVPLKVSGQSILDSVGIGTTSSLGEGLYLQGSSFVQRNATMSLYDSVAYIQGNGAIGVGTTAVRCQVDFADAGKTAAEINPGEGVGARAFMLPPRLTNAQRAGLTTETGAMIYNLDTNKHQGYDGTTWNDFY